ncbi:MAG: BolA/IbaG family iron-sulfur metabolism protein [Sedimenticola sp.]
METTAVEQLIEAGISGCKAQVTGSGCDFEATVISDDFVGKSLLQKQRLVMAAVKTQIASGELHALSIKTFTPDEWNAKS